MNSKKITVDEDGCVALSKFKDIIDIKKVEYYQVKMNEDKTLTVTFYDKNKKKVKPYGAK